MHLFGVGIPEPQSLLYIAGVCGSFQNAPERHLCYTGLAVNLAVTHGGHITLVESQDCAQDGRSGGNAILIITVRRKT